MRYTNYFYLLFALLVMFGNEAASQVKQDNKTGKGKSARTELEQMNRRIRTAYLNGDAHLLTELYADSFILMPEYKPAISSPEDLKSFYTDWFRTVTNTACDRRIDKAERYGNYLLETGTFQLRYDSARTAPRQYAGNYMIMWKRDKKGRLNIMAELFGSSSYLGAGDVPYAHVAVKDSFVQQEHQVSEQLLPQVIIFDSALVRSIRAGDGKARAEAFTSDGLYSPHFSQPVEGMTALLPYLVSVYRPEARLYAAHTYREWFHTDSVVFLTGHFRGGWGDAGNGGTFEGNMFNFLKREKDGTLRMHRQIANNDR